MKYLTILTVLMGLTTTTAQADYQMIWSLSQYTSTLDGGLKEGKGTCKAAAIEMTENHTQKMNTQFGPPFVSNTHKDYPDWSERKSYVPTVPGLALVFNCNDNFKG